MTTAHRPTFHTAVGGKEQGGGRYISGVSRQHVHDLPGQMSIKTRQPGQGTAGELTKAEMLAALEAKEANHLKAIGKAPTLLNRLPPPPPPPDDSDDDDDDGPALLIDPEDADDSRGAQAGAASSSLGLSRGAGGAGSSGAGPAAAADDSDVEEDSDDEEDEEEELMRELERIKKERAAEAAKKAQEASEEAAAEHDASVLQSNPLLDPTRLGGSSSFAVKRRWDDDVVFKNQSREPKKEGKRFINDTVRNDFHKRFLSKYVK